MVSAADSRRVLIVDDHFDTTEVLSVMFEMLGHEVRSAHRGIDALRIARELEPDLVLLDIGLPDISGHEVARWLRADPITARTYIVAITCWDSPDDIARSMSAGFDDHLAKPIGLARIRLLLASAWERARARARGSRPGLARDARVAVA
ncbi:MAG: response regulator [Deltaproteobacteria bacterium]|nr:response regulator [Deltaproteobacteria bacterium]